MLVNSSILGPTCILCRKHLMQSQKKMVRRLAWELVIRIRELHYPWNHRGDGPQVRDAKFQIAKRGVSKNKQVNFERIIEKREKQLQKRLYREAIAELEKKL